MALNFFVEVSGTAPASPVVLVAKLPFSGGLKFYDFAATGGTAGTFATSPTTPTFPLTSNTTIVSGMIGAMCWGYLASPPQSAFTDGYYIYIFMDSNSGASLGSAVVYIQGQDDQGAPSGGSAPSASAVATAVWQDLVSGSDFGVANSIGSVLKGGTSGATPSQIATAVWQDLKNSSDFTTPNSIGALLSTYVVPTTPPTTSDIATAVVTAMASGAVATVTNPVTVGTNNDKSGYSITQQFPQYFSQLYIQANSGYVTSTSSGQEIALAVSGIVAGGSNATSVVVSDLPANRNYTGQRLYHGSSGEARLIISQSYQQGNYTFSFGGGVGELGPFGVSPSPGDIVYPTP